LHLAWSKPCAVTVVEGRARFHVDGGTVELGPGSVVHFPAGTQETFEPLGQVRLVVAYTPGGVDKFFAEAGEPAKSREIPPTPEAPPDIEQLVAVAQRYGVRLLPP
jgi:Cupin domain